MVNYLKEIQAEFSEEINGGETSPASEHLFQTREANKLDRTKSDIFHTTVAQLL